MINYFMKVVKRYEKDVFVFKQQKQTTLNISQGP